MSNIPLARRILQEALDADTPHEHIREALALLDRKKPEFRVKKVARGPLSFREKLLCRKLRNSGLPIHEIALRVNKNQGRVSEALEETEDRAA